MNKKTIFLIILWVLVYLWAFPVEQEPVFTALTGPGQEIRIDETHTFIYTFSEKPKMGFSVLKVQVFDRQGKQVTLFDMTGQCDMPAMRGAHDSGQQPFKLNKKNDYLLPLNIVMPGEWEVRLIFFKDKSPVFHGVITFDV